MFAQRSIYLVSNFWQYNEVVEIEEVGRSGRSWASWGSAFVGDIVTLVCLSPSPSLSPDHDLRIYHKFPPAIFF